LTIFIAVLIINRFKRQLEENNVQHGWLYSPSLHTIYALKCQTLAPFNLD